MGADEDGTIETEVDEEMDGAMVAADAGAAVLAGVDASDDRSKKERNWRLSPVPVISADFWRYRVLVLGAYPFFSYCSPHFYFTSPKHLSSPYCLAPLNWVFELTLVRALKYDEAEEKKKYEFYSVRRTIFLPETLLSVCGRSSLPVVSPLPPSTNDSSLPSRPVSTLFLFLPFSMAMTLLGTAFTMVARYLVKPNFIL